MFIEKFSPKSSEAFFKFHESVSQNSSLDEKTIELIKIAVSSVLRCKHCTDSHTKKALSLGISPEEITDAMLVSALQAAGTQLYWNKEAFDKYL